MIALLLLALHPGLAAQPAPAPAPAAAPVGSRVLVLDFRDDAAGPELVRSVRDTLVVHLSKQPGLTVLSSEDLRRVADLEAQKQAVGCDEQSCLAELAGAVGAELVVFGNVGRLGELIQINISVLDVSRATIRGRETVEVSSPSSVPQRVRAAADSLFGVAAGGSVLVPAGAVVAGVGVVGVGVGALMAWLDLATIKETNGKGGDGEAKRAASDRYAVVDPAIAVVGVVVALGGGALVVAGLELE